MRRTTVYTLEITITEGSMTEEFVRANPVISRTIEIGPNQTLNQLHRTIFEAFGRWDDCHLSEFNMGSGIWDKSGDRYVLQFIYDDPEEIKFNEEPIPAGSLERTRIGKLNLQPDQVFWYWYDFGDSWQHRITVLSVGEAEPGAKYPRVVASVGDSPPQYRGWGEEEWGEEESDEEGSAEVGLSELLDYIADEGDTITGVVPVDRDAPVPWIRRHTSAETGAIARELAAQHSYRVTTLKDLADGTCELTTYLVPGQHLDPWLATLIAPGEGQERVLSVETVL